MTLAFLVFPCVISVWDLNKAIKLDVTFGHGNDLIKYLTFFSGYLFLWKHLVIMYVLLFKANLQWVTQ